MQANAEDAPVCRLVRMHRIEDNSRDNVAPCCITCNRMKHIHGLEAFMSWLWSLVSPYSCSHA